MLPECARSREKKNVVSTMGSATTESPTWLIRMRQIDRPHRAKPGKVRLSMQRMVGDVADQEQGREDKRYRSSTRDGQEYSAGE